MDKNRWHKVEKIVDKALDLQPSERTSYVKRACDGESKLINQVNTLLYYIQKAEEDNFLETPTT